MRLYGHLVFITIIYCSARLSETKERRGHHLLSLFGFRISERHNLPSKPIGYSPVIIIPFLTQKQHVLIQESTSDDNYQENGDVLQRFTLEPNNTAHAHNNATVEDVDQNILQDSEHGIKNEEIQAEETVNDSYRASDNVTDVMTSNNNNSNEVANTTTSINKEMTTTEPVTESQPAVEDTKSYPTAVYNNAFIKYLTLTTSAPTENDFGSMLTLPVNNENWRNFTISDKNSQQGKWFGGKEHFLSTESRWRKFSLPLTYFSSEFRPIAGLYHDGFLHSPLLNRQGFIPSRQVHD